MLVLLCDREARRGSTMNGTSGVRSAESRGDRKLIVGVRIQLGLFVPRYAD